MTDVQAENNKKVKVNLIILSRLEHNRLIITGFHELYKKGKIELKISEDYKRGSELPCEGLTEAVIDDKIKIAFDTMDGYNFPPEQMDKYLDQVDYCFKRSYSKELNQKLLPVNASKVFPLSLNYDVSYLFNPMEYRHNIKDLYVFCRKLIKGNSIKSYETLPKEPSEKVLFMCRLWNPNSSEAASNKALVEDREAINKTRIELVRALKNEFGNKFLGGIFDDEYARSICPDLVLERNITDKKHYLSLMKDCGICVATTGLHNSIGWKFAEYVAAGKAIVSEPLHYEVYGEFAEGKNYLVFTDTKECVDQIKKLLTDSELRRSMGNANRYYYNNFERPDMQIQNALSLIKKNN